MGKPLPNSIKQLDLNLFIVFEAIYREQNLTRASEVLNLSQPAVSHALGRLRERLNDPLFERRGKHMKPSPLAEDIIEDIRKGIAHFEQAIYSDHGFHAQDSERQFSMALPGILEAPLIKKMAREMSSQAPNISLKSLRIKRSELEQSLKSGKADIAVDIYLPTSDEIACAKSSQDELVVLLRKDHPIIQKENSALSLARYLQAQHIFVTNRHYGLGAEDHALAKAGHTRDISITCQHFYAAAQVVTDSDFLLTVPKLYAQTLNQENHFILLPFPVNAAPLEMYIYSLKNTRNDPGLKWFKAFLHDCVNGLVETNDNT